MTATVHVHAKETVAAMCASIGQLLKSHNGERRVSDLVTFFKKEEGAIPDLSNQHLLQLLPLSHRAQISLLCGGCACEHALMLSLCPGLRST